MSTSDAGWIAMILESTIASPGNIFTVKSASGNRARNASWLSISSVVSTDASLNRNSARLNSPPAGFA